MQATTTASPDVLGSDVHLLEVVPRNEDIRRAIQLVATSPPLSGSAARNAVLANLVGVIAHGEPDDYERAAALSVQLGHHRVADLQGELDGCLGTGPHLPFATAAIIKLSRTAQIEAALLGAGRSIYAAQRVATRCANAAFWLLMADIDPRRRAPMPRTPDDLVLIFERRGADAWRRILANIAANPWGPTATRLAGLARAADLVTPAQAIERCERVYRERSGGLERAEVAREIRRLVAVSGCSQREFARYVGTSAPRLSTYVNGLVTPSATMMLRIGRQSSALANKRTVRTG